VAYLNQLVTQMNTILQNNPLPTDPWAGVCGSCHIQDSRIRFNLKGISCYADDGNYGTSNVIANAINPDKEINIFFMGDIAGDSGDYPVGGFIINPPNIYLGNANNGFSLNLQGDIRLCVQNYHRYFVNGNGNFATVNNLLHELGHAMGLMHTYFNTCCHESCNSTNFDYLADVFGPTQISYCWDDTLPCNPPSFIGDRCSNNFMSFKGHYLSPRQQGRIHRNTMLTRLRRYTCGYSTNPYYVGTNEPWSYSNQTWDFNIKFYQDIVVKSGTTLTIKCRVEMVPEAKIIVEPNARLIIDGGTITVGTSSGCSNLWQGIYVWGNSAQHQYTYGNNQLYQGFVELKNGAIIENAIVGIQTLKIGDSQMLFTGGIIQASNSTFRNNRTDIGFNKYTNFNPSNFNQKRGNLSFFRNCSFITTSNLTDGTNPSNHVTMWNVDGVRFYGCTFENSNPTALNNNSLGNGIYTEDAHFIVSGCDWLAINCPAGQCCNFTPNIFRNLNFGIRARRIAGITYNYNVDKNTFTNCVTSISNEAVDNGIFTRNNLTIGKPRFPAFFTVGVNFNVGTNFRIEENVVSRDPSFTTYSLGTWLTNTGNINNQVYKNTFTGVNVGNYAYQRNRGVVNGLAMGLGYLCNSHSSIGNNDISIYGTDVNLDGIRQYQGILNPSGTLATASAGNTFTRSGANTESDIANPNTPNITYYYDGSPILGNPKYPFYVTSGGRVTRSVAPQNTCPSSFNSGSGKNNNESELKVNNGILSNEEKQSLISAYQSNLQLLNQYKGLYHTLIDGGNTTQMKQDIDNARPSETWQLRQKLLGESPYLSKEVLLETADKTNVIPDAILFEILAANPDGVKDEELTKYLTDKTNPMPLWMVDLLKEGAVNQVTSRTMLEATISHHKAQHDLLVSYLAQDIISQRNENQEINHQELRSWLASYQSVNGDYQIVDDFFETQNYNDGLSLLATIPTTYQLNKKELEEYNQLTSYFSAIASIFNSGRTLKQIDSNELLIIQEIADNGEGMAKVRACNLLGLINGTECVYDLQLPAASSASFKNEAPKGLENVLLPTIHLFPNPAKDYIQFSYKLPISEKTARLVISDINGHQIYETELTSNYGQLAIDTRSWATGTYSYSLNTGGKSIASNKFIVTK